MKNFIVPTAILNDVAAIRLKHVPIKIRGWITMGRSRWKFDWVKPLKRSEKVRLRKELEKQKKLVKSFQ